MGLKSLFDEWVVAHGRSYADALTHEYRFRTWLTNLEKVMAHNATDASYRLGLTRFADLSHSEFRAEIIGKSAAKLTSSSQFPFTYADVDATHLPPIVDWRANGAVSHVKNQGACGSCWAFSTTGAVEGINAIYSGEMVELSEQELLDCDHDNEFGCNGGDLDFAFKWIHENGGISTEEAYRYQALDMQCNLDQRDHGQVVSIDGYADVPPNDEMSLKKAVAFQPVSVAIQADSAEFQLYASGVFDAECGTNLNHGVLAVGYGTHAKHHVRGGNWWSRWFAGEDVAKKDTSYWIVKNSWGPGWGDGGFINMKMGVQAEGICGIAMAATYPIKNHDNPVPQPTRPPTPPGPGPFPPPPEPTPIPPPGPVMCDFARSCPAGTTCCCSQTIQGLDVCLEWGCCPFVNATCCDDHQHCCPAETPVCDVQGGRCTNGARTLYHTIGVKTLAINHTEAAFLRG